MKLLFKDKLSVARRANVVVIRVGAIDRAQRNVIALPDPTLRTLEMTAERRREIERALTRYARSLEPRFKFSDVKLRIAYFLTKGKVAALEFIYHLNGYLFQFGIRIGHDWLLSKNSNETRPAQTETPNVELTSRPAVGRSG